MTNVDIVKADGSPIDERATLTVTFNVKTPTGTARTITGYTAEWNATHNGEVMITKSTALATLTVGTSSITFTLLPINTVLPDVTNYGTPVIYYHEARLINGSNEYVAVRGRLPIMPSQTGV